MGFLLICTFPGMICRGQSRGNIRGRGQHPEPISVITASSGFPALSTYSTLKGFVSSHPPNNNRGLCGDPTLHTRRPGLRETVHCAQHPAVSQKVQTRLISMCRRGPGSVSSLPIGHLSHSCLNKGLILTSRPRVGTRALVSEFMKLHPSEVFRHSRVSLALSSVGPHRRRDAFSMSPVMLWGRMTAVPSWLRSMTQIWSQAYSR